jgi:lysophospholipase L1-like esterase
MPVDTIPAETAELGRSEGGTSVLTVPGEPRWLFVRRDGQTERWLPLPPRRVSRNVLFVGDSIADGAEPDLTAALSTWTVTFDAVVGRPSIGGVAPAAAAASLRPGPDVVVVELGTNDADPAAFEANLRTILTSLAAVPLVVWQTVHSPQPAAIEVNAAGRRVAATFPNVAIADWNAFVPPAALSSDGVHPLPDHEGLMAKLVAPLLSSWAEAADGTGPAACVPVSTGVRSGIAGA